MTDKVDCQMSLQNLQKRIAEADSRFDDWARTGEDWYDPSWYIEACFLQLLALAESLGLGGFHQMVLAEYSKLSSSKQGFRAVESTPDGDPYSAILSRARCFKQALDGFFPEEPMISVTKDVLQILRDVHYVIADPKIFGSPPANEADVHVRIEGILKCVFPDLKRKPMLTKQIKNFEPDTGIPSVRTLIEYKFLSRSEDVGTIADQILADTRGYTSRDWIRFLYVIYETNRIRKESEWNQLLRESGVPESTVVVVLSGEPVARSARKKVRAGNPTAVSTAAVTRRKSQCGSGDAGG
jgi:sulfur carrier protein ThiS